MALTKTPKWITRLERSCKPGRYYASVLGLCAVGAALSAGFLGRDVVFVGLVLQLGISWYVLTHAGKRAWLASLCLVSALVAFPLSIFVIQDKALDARGEKVSAQVIEVKDQPKTRSCVLKLRDGTRIGSLGGCYGPEVTDWIKVYVDHKGEVPPSRSEPNPTLWISFSIYASAICTHCAVLAAVIGVREQRDLLLKETQLAALRPPAPPPPMPPPPLRAP